MNKSYCISNIKENSNKCQGLKRFYLIFLVFLFFLPKVSLLKLFFKNLE